MEILHFYLFVVFLVLISILIYMAYTTFKYISKLKLKIRDNCLYVCILIETVYTYKNSPQLLRDRLLQEMTIKKLLCYHLVEDDENFFPSDLKCTKRDKLLYKLHLEGFTYKELCILFELNNLNSVYVKCHRINKKLNDTETPAKQDSE